MPHRLQIVIFCFIVVSSCRSSHDEVVKDDLASFTESAYDSMKTFYLDEPTFVRMLDARIGEGDTSAVKVRKLLSLPYAVRQKSGLTEREIGTIIQSFRISAAVLKKFQQIDSTLRYIEDKGNIDNDSLLIKKKELNELLEVEK